MMAAAVLQEEYFIFFWRRVGVVVVVVRARAVVFTPLNKWIGNYYVCSRVVECATRRRRRPNIPAGSGECSLQGLYSLNQSIATCNRQQRITNKV